MADRYWVGGSGNWNSTNTGNWAATSGGASGASAPVAGDNVFFDGSSDSGATFTVTVVATGPTIQNLTVSGLDQSMVLAGSTGMTIQGDITLPASGMTWTQSGGVTMSGSVSRTITTNNVSIASSLTINATAPSLITLGSDLTLGSNRTITYTRSGLLDFAGYNVTCAGIGGASANTRALTLGTGTVTINGSGGGAWNLTGATNLTLTTTGSTILFTSASAKTFGGNGYTYNIVKNAGAGALTVAGSNTFAEIGNTVQPTTVTFTSGTTQTVTTFSLTGTVGNLVTINASTPGSAATLSKASGTVSASYLSLQDSTATGGATWTALSSTNVSGNTGWAISAQYTSSILASTGPVAAIVRSGSKPLRVTSQPVSAVVRQTAKAFSVSSTLAAAVEWGRSVVLTASTAASASLVRQAGKLALANNAAVSSVVRSIGKRLRATTTALASLLSVSSVRLLTDFLIRQRGDNRTARRVDSENRTGRSRR